MKNLFKRKKEKELSVETKAVLSILIREVRDVFRKHKPEIVRIIEDKGKGGFDKFHASNEIWLNAMDDLNILLDSWVKANNLHPEDVEVCGNCLYGSITDKKGRVIKKRI